MREEDDADPRFLSKQWWADTNPYWGERRSGPWEWACSVVSVLLLIGGAYFFNNTRETWLTVAVLLTVLVFGSVTARPGRRRDVARLRRHQFKQGNYPSKEG